MSFLVREAMLRDVEASEGTEQISLFSGFPQPVRPVLAKSPPLECFWPLAFGSPSSPPAGGGGGSDAEKIFSRSKSVSNVGPL